MRLDFLSAKREFATICTPISVSEEFELNFDKTYKLIRTPKNFDVKDPTGIEFSAQYVVMGNKLRGLRKLIMTQTHHLCTQEQYTSRLPTLDAIERHLAASVLVERY
jgi:hypothetical protein